MEPFELYEFSKALVSGVVIVSIFSFLYKENIAYRIIEHMYIAVALGVVLITSIGNIINAVSSVIAGKIISIIPILMGLLLCFTLLPKKHRYPSFISLALLVGLTSALGFRGDVGSAAVQIRSTAGLSPFTPDPLTNFNNILIISGVICVLLYFIFTKEHTGPLKYLTKYGRYMMMAGFGSLYGGTIIQRYAVVLGSINQLIFTPGVYVLPPAIIIILIYIVKGQKKKG